ncbi:unnamed protein product [marine sediment metagenome]|uniref:Uncharacterized protein n=1 Tax=marine sediment metagenome TaxID=412755 RepID=X0SZC6_9ZZZZ
MLLTGNKDVDFLILDKLEDSDLIKMCNINKEAMQLCNNNQHFWLNRIMSKFPYLGLKILTKYKGDRSWSQYYIKDLRKLNNANSNNIEQLFNASEKGRLDHVIIAMNKGADIHAQDDFAVKIASENGHLDIVKYLVSQGANIHADNDFSVILASQYGHLDTVKYLVSQDANIHTWDDFAVIWASENGHTDVVDYLVSLGAPRP